MPRSADIALARVPPRGMTAPSPSPVQLGHRLPALRSWPMRLARCVLLGVVAGGAWLVIGGGGGAISGTAGSGRPSHVRLAALRAGERVAVGRSAGVAQATVLSAVRTAFVALPGRPFGVATTADGRWSFVDQLGGRVEVFSDAGFAPSAVRTIVVPGDAVGNSITRDGRYLLIADGEDGATVVSIARALSGNASGAVLGALKEPREPRLGPRAAIEVASSLNSRYAFVSIEGAHAIAVYDLRVALRDRFRTSGYLGSVPLGPAPVGIAVSPNGRWLYATSERARIGSQRGTLSVISVAEAERHPAGAVLATVPAGFSPVRVVASSDGSVVWVTARGGDQLLAFAAKQLRSDPARALLATVRVGRDPVGLELVADGRQVIVADRGQSGLTVISTAAALAHRPAVIGTIPAGSQPREMALEPNGDTLLVGNFSSDQLEAVDVAHLR
jgi:DNA-binding beta-propeller fold protein YncE